VKNGEINFDGEVVIIDSLREALHYPLISKYLPMPRIIEINGSRLIVEKVDFIYDLRTAVYQRKNFFLARKIIEDIVGKVSLMWREYKKKAGLGLSIFRAEFSETISGLEMRKEIYGVVEKAVKKVKKGLKKEPPFVTLIHGDLKGSNILVTSERPVDYRVIDLEWSTEYGDPVEEGTRIFKWVSSVTFKQGVPSMKEINKLKRFQKSIEKRVIEKISEIGMPEKYIEEMKGVYLLAAYLREMFLTFRRIPESRQKIARDFLRDVIEEVL